MKNTTSYTFLRNHLKLCNCKSLFVQKKTSPSVKPETDKTLLLLSRKKCVLSESKTKIIDAIHQNNLKYQIRLK